MSSGLSVDGVRELERAADAAATQLADTTAADRDAAALVGPTAAATAPRATGRTAGSISWGADPEGGAQVLVGVEWSVPLHWGAPANGQPARPWVAAAWAAREADVVKVYEGHADAAVATFEK